MAKAKTHYNEIPTDQWSANHLRDYLYAKHEEHLGVKYVARNFAVDTRMLKNFVSAYGVTVAKRFIDVCLANYTPTANYPGTNFAFIQTYMKERYLPQCLKAEVMAERVAEVDNEIDADWL
ncbi:hypothetical protein AB1282_00550 [Gottfriedia sp. S16(2024)]|uniref:hypothetical protein n=1 Tax=Gottfriedia sp. S16(2024) TaxID=3162883 RepID=UPI003D1FE3D7